jgi:16S rRNA G966 N2-methylase RsmD
MEITKEIDDFIEEHKEESIDKLVLKIRNQFEGDPQFIINQINGRKKVAEKIPSWAKVKGLIFPSVTSFEQSSSELTSRYKASLVGGNTLLDLTGGFGVDTYFFSKRMNNVVYFEKDEALLEYTKHNFEVLKVQNIDLHLGDSTELIATFNEEIDWIYIDPSRRTSDNDKIVTMEDSIPNIIQLKDTLFRKASNILLKLSPMLDLNQIVKKLVDVEKILVVAVKNECKEILVHLKKKTTSAITLIPIVGVNIKNREEINEFYSDFEQRKTVNNKVNIQSPGIFIYEPNKAILKAGVQNHLAGKMGIGKLSNNSNFFTADQQLENFPGRIFKKIDIIKPKKKLIRKFLDEGKANVIARNFPLKASQIYERYKIVPGGKNYFLATKLDNNDNVIIICNRIQ